MASERMDPPPPQRTENGLRAMAVFQEESAQFSRGAGDAVAQKPRAARFAVHSNEKLFAVERDHRFFRPEEAGMQRCIYGSPSRTGAENQDWHGEGSNGTPSGDGSDDMGDGDDDDEQDEEDDADEGDGEVDGLVCAEDGGNKGRYNSSSSLQSSSEKIRQDNVDSHEHHSSFGSRRGVVVNDGSGSSGKGSLSEQQQKQGQVGNYDKRTSGSEPDLYCNQIIQGGDGLGRMHKELGRENGFGCSWRRDISLSVDSGESVRAHLSDPITGVLMDDAMILACGHSYGSGGLQHVTRMKACLKCHQPISEDKVLPNLALRLAVQAFHREEELQSSKVSKRRRDRLDQEKCNYDDPFYLDLARGKGVQFPFAVSDRVIIKGNKRTPQRFVGRIAVVTTQCLNGWVSPDINFFILNYQGFGRNLLLRVRDGLLLLLATGCDGATCSCERRAFFCCCGCEPATGRGRAFFCCCDCGCDGPQASVLLLLRAAGCGCEPPTFAGRASLLLLRLRALVGLFDCEHNIKGTWSRHWIMQKV